MNSAITQRSSGRVRLGPPSAPGRAGWSPRAVEASRSRCAASLTSIGDSDYSRVSRGVIDLCTQLRALGVSSDIKLPTLVTAGNQSSGKSSVVEGIAGIPLPRATGTCTRCPTEVRMRRGDGKESWCCTIKLKREYDAVGQKLAEIPPEEVFCSIQRQEDITLCVSAAQAAMLNPCMASRDFIPLDLWPTPAAAGGPRHSDVYNSFVTNEKENELEFTSNSVVLEIIGAEVDLAIVDLPGIIQSHPKGPNYVDMIRQMVTRTIEDDHVIIVMTLTAMDDLENQAINLIAREKDPEGQRMVGVITKPDNIPQGEHHKWLQLARNENTRQNLRLGYYVVKNPGQVQLDEAISFQDARRLESEFFASNLHWSQVHADIGHRLGTHKLRDALSQLLLTRIQKELPDIRRNTEEKLKEINGKIRRLPKPVSDNVEFEFYDMLKQVAASLSDEVHGQTSGSKHTYQSFQASYRNFQKNVKGSMPVFQVKGVRFGVTGIDGHFEEDDTADSEGDWTVEQVQQLRKSHVGAELPSFSPYSAVVALISVFKGRWNAAAEACVQEVKVELQQQVEDSLGAFEQFPAMRSALSPVMAALLDQAADACVQQLTRLSAMEERDIFTLNTEGFMEAKNRYLSSLKMKQLGIEDLNAVSKLGLKRDILDNLAKLGIKFKRVEDIALAQPTAVDDELHMMAATLAYMPQSIYFEVSYMRFVDEVPLHVRDYLLYAFAHKEQLPRAVYNSIKKQPDGGIRELLAEDAAISGRRKQLQDQWARLKEAQTLLQQYKQYAVVA